MRLSKRMGVGATLVSLTASLLAVSSPASAATTPPWEPDPNALGTLSFYDASGAVVTSGNNLSHLFDYALASTDAARSGTTKATLYFGFPDHTKSDTTAWSAVSASASTNFPNSNYPAPLNNTGRRPLGHPGAADANLASPLGVQTLDQTDGYKNLVQVRLKDSGPGNGFQTQFWDADIMFDQAAGTWTQVYPAPVVAQPTSTTTALAVSPTSPQTVGSTVTLTATVSPSAAGTVQFFDGSTAIGSPVTVTSGSATTTTSSLAAGSHSLTAVFSPTDTTAFTGSTSTAQTYVINAPAAMQTTTTLTVTPTSPQVAGTDVGLTATVSPTAPGTVQFFDGTTAIGSPVTVTEDGKATTSTSTLTVGSHDLTAAFTPSDATKFSSSTSDKSTYVITAKPATETTTTLDVTPTSPQDFGTAVTLKASVAPAEATGTVQFFDGATALGSPVTVASGSATTATSALTAGPHDLKATFTPADSALYTTSTSAVSTFVVAATAPGAPTAVSATPGNASATVTWKAPANTGGAAITGYTVQYSSDGGKTFTPAAAQAGTATTQTVTGLTNGTAYVFQVAATNSVGTGDYSTSSTAVTPTDATDTLAAINVSANNVQYNHSVDVFASFVDSKTRAGITGPVTLYGRANATSRWTFVRTVELASNGTASATVTLTQNSQFEWRFAGSAGHNPATTPTRSVGVLQAIGLTRTATSIKSGGTVTYYGVLAPTSAGQTIVLQKRTTTGNWYDYATAPIKSQKLPNGRTLVGFVIPLTLTVRGDYVFRAYKAATPTLMAGTTAGLGVHVS